jgi:predicted nucleotide-binding protein (sugar kinase/HSP70/actin superfamily)
MISFNEFLQKVDDTFLNHQAARSRGKIKAENQWRYGQTVMNVLWEVWPEKHKQIQGTDLDCFYCNSTVDLALDHLEKNWTRSIS